ncbi:unnamed protein product [Ascophyllum nodosum]
MASSRGQRPTVQQKKKASRALVRARRVRESSIATVLRGETWSGYEGPMRAGLRELDEMDATKKRGTYASKPLVSPSLDEEEEEDNRILSARDAWAENVEGIWNEILQADSLATKPRIVLPGFPIEVVKVKIARDYGHQKIFWDLTEASRHPPESILRQLREMQSKGHDAELVVLKTTAVRLKKQEGFLRASLAKRLPMRRVPEVRWQHVSEMPTTLRLGV